MLFSTLVAVALMEASAWARPVSIADVTPGQTFDPTGFQVSTTPGVYTKPVSLWGYSGHLFVQTCGSTTGDVTFQVEAATGPDAKTMAHAIVTANMAAGWNAVAVTAEQAPTPETPALIWSGSWRLEATGGSFLVSYLNKVVTAVSHGDC